MKFINIYSYAKIKVQKSSYIYKNFYFLYTTYTFVTKKAFTFLCLNYGQKNIFIAYKDFTNGILLHKVFSKLFKLFLSNNARLYEYYSHVKEFLYNFTVYKNYNNYVYVIN